MTQLNDWFKANKLTLNVKKTKFILFSDATIKMDNLQLKLGTNILSRWEAIAKKNISNL